jgi:hypothetical protein
MTDLKNLLELSLTNRPGLGNGDLVDPAGDLARGRHLLRRRRRAVLSASAAGAAGVAVVALAVANGGPSAAGHPPVAARPPATAHPSAAGHPSAAAHPSGHPLTTPPVSVALVAYDGQQAPGYQVAKVPSGWVIQGGNPYVLTIAPADDPDKNVDAFVGKLVVMLQSRDATDPSGPGRPQQVAGRPGHFDVQGDTQMLTYQDAKGHWIVIQAPVSLGWDSAQLADFAAGVQVLHNAQQGRG